MKYIGFVIGAWLAPLLIPFFYSDYNVDAGIGYGVGVTAMWLWVLYANHASKP